VKLQSRLPGAGCRRPSLLAALLVTSLSAWANEVEPMLLGALQEIQASRIRAAELQVDELLRRFPNFRLGHLIKGDLLLAHARPLSGMGDGARISGTRIDALRAEAVARARRAWEPPPPGALPRGVWQLATHERHLLVVDTSTSRLFVFENQQGKLERVADYYVSIGRLGAGKTREGDQKTPVGIYHTTGSISPAKLTDFYGSGAFPLNYPNEWDRRQGHGGHGIWLHGTPSDTYSRPPFASDGCVVLANRELEELAARLDDASIPVIITPRLEWAEPEQIGARTSEFRRDFEAWRGDWESLDTERYLRHYALTFRTQGKDLAAWRVHKQSVNAQKRYIRVGVSNLSVFQYPGHDALAVVSFDQDYQSDQLSNRMRKEQYWQKFDGRWQIIYEGPAAAPLTAVAQARGGLIKVAAKWSRKPPKTKRS
jgi:murein L,D-transpeptidase YafK